MKQILVSQNSLYRYNLYGSISDFNNYNDFIGDIPSMSPQDAVALYINSPGGRVDIGVSIISAIQNSEVPITAIIEGPCYSMASVIALACSSVVMLDNTFLMFHNYSSGGFGKGGELTSSIHHNDEHFNRLMNKVCYPFLTKSELKKIRQDQDVYIYSDDKSLDQRCKRHFKG